MRKLSVQLGLCGSNDLRVGRKMATFQLIFQSGRVKDLSAHLYLHREGGNFSPNHFTAQVHFLTLFPSRKPKLLTGRKSVWLSKAICKHF